LPTETGRIIKRKRITLPSGGTVDVPVIIQITFIDVVSQAQEAEFHLLNDSTGNRDVHIASVPGGGAATDESGSGSGLKVERVDLWRVLDIVDKAQESFIHFDNRTIEEPPQAPPFFITHEKSHVVKYINTPDDGNWIKSELIDRFKVLDIVEQAQETEFFLFNPPDNTGIAGLTLGTDSDGTTVAVDSTLAEIGDALDPVRTDPFQNIIDHSAPMPSAKGFQVFIFRHWLSSDGAANNGLFGDWYPVDESFWETAALAGETTPAWSGVPGVPFNLETVGEREKRSVLISDFLDLSNVFTDIGNPPGNIGGIQNPRQAWLNASGFHPIGDAPAPSRHEGTPIVYIGVQGTFRVDDLSTGQLEDLINAAGHPPFTPP
jgi:hypothetical protein